MYSSNILRPVLDDISITATLSDCIISNRLTLKTILYAEIAQALSHWNPTEPEPQVTFFPSPQPGKTGRVARAVALE